MVHFYRGIKQPKVGYKGSIYYLERRREKTTIWKCGMYYRTKCKARITTFEKTLKELCMDHNHGPTSLHENSGILKTYKVKVIRKSDDSMKI